MLRILLAYLPITTCHCCDARLLSHLCTPGETIVSLDVDEVRRRTQCSARRAWSLRFPRCVSAHLNAQQQLSHPTQHLVTNTLLATSEHEQHHRQQTTVQHEQQQVVDTTLGHRQQASDSAADAALRAVATALSAVNSRMDLLGAATGQHWQVRNVLTGSGKIF